MNSDEIIKMVQQKVEEKNEVIREQLLQLQDKEQQIAEKDAKIAELEAKIAEFEHSAESLAARLSEVLE
ncbi:MAG: hypothetical protein BWZ10_01286 [candidate division BRC1 bacterium ADurb.BinA364]|nr:MAG: hypothetical protein BWZ10_01286 [candidate division BRC1 bacterium ADurb.BinA364]